MGADAKGGAALRIGIAVIVALIVALGWGGWCLARHDAHGAPISATTGPLIPGLADGWMCELELMSRSRAYLELADPYKPWQL